MLLRTEYTCDKAPDHMQEMHIQNAGDWESDAGDFYVVCATYAFVKKYRNH